MLEVNAIIYCIWLLHYLCSTCPECPKLVWIRLILSLMLGRQVKLECLICCGSETLHMHTEDVNLLLNGITAVCHLISALKNVTYLTMMATEPRSLNAVKPVPQIAASL